MRHLESAGICEVVVVCGFGIDQVRAVVEAHPSTLRVKLLYNPFYAVSDNLISLWAARAEMDDGFILINGDNVFHPAILIRLLASDGECCLMAKRKAAYDDDDMKLMLCGDRVARIGKHLPAQSTDAESIGIVRFSKKAVPEVVAMLEEIVVEEQALNSYFPAGIQHLIDRGYPVGHCDAGDLPCADVDTPDDLHRVRRDFHLYRASALSMAQGGHQGVGGGS